MSFWKGLHEQVGSENNKLRVSWLPSTLSLVLPSSSPLCRPYWGPEGLTDFTPVQKLLKGGGRLLPLLGPQLRWVHVFLEGRGLSVFSKVPWWSRGAAPWGLRGATRQLLLFFCL